MRIASCRALLVLAVAIYAVGDAEQHHNGNAIEVPADPPAPPAEALGDSDDHFSVNTGYANLASILEDGWGPDFADTIAKLSECQISGRGLGVCHSISKLGSLSRTTIAVDGDHAVFNVTGTWDGTSCSLTTRVLILTCPASVNDFSRSSCQLCSEGYMKMTVETWLNTNSGCDEWFARADQIARSALSIMRVDSMSRRMQNCRIWGGDGPSQYGFHECSSLAGKKCPSGDDRSHKITAENLGECLSSCTDNTACAYASVVLYQGEMHCIGCKETPSAGSTHASTFAPISTTC